GDRLERNAPRAERLKQLGCSKAPFVADEHGVGLELPGGMKSGQYVTHAAHRMRHEHLRPLPSSRAVSPLLRASGSVRTGQTPPTRVVLLCAVHRAVCANTDLGEVPQAVRARCEVPAVALGL